MPIRRQRAEPWHDSSPGVRVRRVLQSPRGDLNLYRIEPGCRIPPHSHPESHVGVVLDGGGISRWRGTLHRLVAGEGYQVPRGVVHEFESDPVGTTVLLELELPPPLVEGAGDAGRELLGAHAEGLYLVAAPRGRRPTGTGPSTADAGGR